MDDIIFIEREFVLDAIDIGLSGYITDDDKLTLEGMGIAVSALPKITCCKDCKYGLKVVSPITGIFCTRFGPKNNPEVEDDDFCSYGEMGGENK